MSSTEYKDNIIPEEFADIAPYRENQYTEVMTRLVKEPGFEHAVRYAMPGVDYDAFVEGLLSVKTQSRFQQDIMGKFLEGLAATTTAGISIDGLENCDRNKNYTFISNHRDIVLDASFLNLCFIREKMPLTQVAIGNNLLIYEWITDLVKLNRSFIVKRDSKVVKALENAKQLSGYIHYTINKLHESVWIAQREGRAKDSNDMTQESLIKMMSLAGEGDTRRNLIEINMMPVSISYEFDPNDYLKAREFLLKRRDPEYKKTQRDDLFSMETGLLRNKGRIHFRLGRCVNDLLEQITTTDRSEIAHEVCSVIDKAIHCGYRIYPCNYIAYDKINNTDRFADHYTQSDVDSFENYVNAQLDKVELDDVTPDEREYMYSMMLTMYANPLKNQLAAVGC
ncbi:MAG: acyltransferase [Muribaculaceae bacterium]